MNIIKQQEVLQEGVKNKVHVSAAQGTLATWYTAGRGDVHLQVTKTKRRAMVLDRSYR